MAFPTSLTGVLGFYPGYKGFTNPAFPGAGYPNGLNIATGLPVKIVGTQDITNAALYGIGGLLDTETLILTVNGVGPVTLTFAGAGNSLNEAAMLAAIDAAFPGLLATQVPNGVDLLLTDLARNGAVIVGAGSANAHLGLTPGTFRGAAATAHPAILGGRPILNAQVP